MKKGFYRHMMYDPELGESHGVVEVLGLGFDRDDTARVVALKIHPGILRVGEFELISIDELRLNYTQIEDRKLLKRLRKLSAKLEVASS